MPSGDSPLGTGMAGELSHASFTSSGVLPIPSGQWPDGTGGSPVLPIPISEFGLNRLVEGGSGPDILAAIRGRHA